MDNSSLASVFLLLNNMIGAGFLVQPYVFMSAGILLTTIAYIIFGVATYTGTQVLITIADYSCCFDFSVIVLNALGPIGAMALDLSVAIFNFGAILTYTLMLGSLSQSLVMEAFGYSSFPVPWYLSEPIFTIFWTVAVIYPFSLAKKYGHLTIVAYFSIGMVLVSILLVSIEGPYLYATEHEKDPLVWFSVAGLFRTVGSVVFALGFAPAVLHTYGSADPTTKVHFQHVALVTTILGASICYCVGLIGYLTFRSDTHSDILENFTGYVALFCKIGVLLHFNFLIPGYFVVMRSSVYHLLQLFSSTQYWWFSTSKTSTAKLQAAMAMNPREYFNLDDVSDENPTNFLVITTVLLFTFTIVACIIEVKFGHDNSSLNFVVDLTGGVAGSLVFFVFPALCGIRELKVNGPMYMRSWAILIFGIFTACFVSAGTILS